MPAWVETIWRDLRYTVRSLRRSPGLAFTAILSLTLGLGASLAVFTVADNLLVRPLPYRDASRLVMIWLSNPARGGDRSEVTPGDYLDWKTQNDVLAGVAAVGEGRAVLMDGDQVE